MTTRATLTLDGFDAYLETLAKAGQDIDRVAEQCLAAGSDVLVGGMQKRAPYGLIKQAIRKTVIMADGNKRYLYLGVLRGTDAETARIAAVWEFGGRTTPSPKNPRRKPRPGIKARPYIRPTLRNDAKKARAAMEDVFQDWLK
jgi:hypothetical protein